MSARVEQAGPMEARLAERRVGTGKQGSPTARPGTRQELPGKRVGAGQVSTNEPDVPQPLQDPGEFPGSPMPPAGRKRTFVGLLHLGRRVAVREDPGGPERDEHLEL